LTPPQVLAEGNELWIRQILPMEDDDKPLAPRGFDLSALRQRFRRVGTVDFSTQWGVPVLDRYSHRLSLDAFDVVSYPNQTC